MKGKKVTMQGGNQKQLINFVWPYEPPKLHQFGYCNIVESVEELVVTFKTKCWNGRILALANYGNKESMYSDSVMNDFSKNESSDDMKGCESLCKNRSDDDDDAKSLCSSVSDFMDLDTDEEDGGRIVIDLTLDDSCAGSEGEEPDNKDSMENEEPSVESKEYGSLAVDAPEYASEEWVRTLPNPPVLCTNVDIDRCVGKLLITEHDRRKKVGILDRESILDLQAKSCALEEFCSVSNEVEIGSECSDEAGSECSDVERHIPLSNSSVDEVRKTNVPKVSEHMLSIQASSIVNTTSETYSPR